MRLSKRQWAIVMDILVSAVFLVTSILVMDWVVGLWRAVA